jgi:hypothetical protein
MYLKYDTESEHYQVSTPTLEETASLPTLWDLLGKGGKQIAWHFDLT